MSDRTALLAAITATPAEDTPRLVFADWLDEHGESERAEFIRAQVGLARSRCAALPAGVVHPLSPPCPGCEQAAAHRRRCEEILAAERDWFDAPAGWRTVWNGVVDPLAPFGVVTWSPGPDPTDPFDAFRRGLEGFPVRGFIGELHCTLRAWITHHETIRASHPIEVVRVSGHDGIDELSLSMVPATASAVVAGQRIEVGEADLEAFRRGGMGFDVPAIILALVSRRCPEVAFHHLV